MSCLHGHFNIVLFLLKYKPDINISINEEESFNLACENGHLEIAKFLLKYKPDIDICTNNNQAFIFSCINGYSEVGHFLVSLKPNLYHLESDKSGKIINFYIKVVLPIIKTIKLIDSTNARADTECPQIISL